MDYLYQLCDDITFDYTDSGWSYIIYIYENYFTFIYIYIIYRYQSDQSNSSTLAEVSVLKEIKDSDNNKEIDDSFLKCIDVNNIP